MDGLTILMVIAMTCQVHPAGGMFGTSLKEVDAFQKDCQKNLISCYESKFPRGPLPTAAEKNAQWLGDLKDCIKSR